MNQNQPKTETKKRHILHAENRRELVVEGVEDVDAYNDQMINAKTNEGRMLIEGTGLHILSLTLENGVMHITGLIDNIAYTDREASKQEGGFFSRLFR